MWYLYSTPSIPYSQLLIAAWKDWVRARAALTTKPVEGTAKLKHQITQLMAALTQTGWDNGHTSTLSSPWECGHGCGPSRGGRSTHPVSHNSRGGPCQQMTQAQSLLTECVGEDMGRRSSKQGNQGPSARGEGAAGSTNPLSPVLQVPGIGPHGQRVPYTGIHFKPAWAKWENAAHPSQWQPPKATISPMHSHPNPGQRTVNMRAARQRQVGGEPSHPLSKPRPDHPPSGLVQWSTHYHWWVESDHVNQLKGTGL